MTARSSRLAIVGTIAFIAMVVAAITWGPLGLIFERAVGTWQNAIAARLSGPSALSGWRLYAVAFAGGLIASISPCILGNASTEPVVHRRIEAARSRAAALRVATMFVLGVIVVNVVLGLVSSLFFALFVEYRAFVNIAVGFLTVIMGFWMAGLFQLRTPQFATRIRLEPVPLRLALDLRLLPPPAPVRSSFSFSALSR